MNKQLLDQVSAAMQAQQDTIARQNLMLDQKDQDIKALRDSLMKLSESKTQQTEALPALLENLSESMKSLIHHHQAWSQAQAKIQSSQQILTKELLALAESQTSSISLMTTYQSKLPRLTTLKAEVKNYEQELDQLSLSQRKINTELTKLSVILK